MNPNECVLRDAKDWRWYKLGLDAKNRKECVHKGEPESYPCRVDSCYIWGGLTEQDYFVHTFTYKQPNVCVCCGMVQS